MIRIVKLTFKEEEIANFLSYFDSINHIVNNFPGCKGMKLLQDKSSTNIIFTYSHWDDESDLENYRNSTAFKEIWSTIKPMFKDKAQAWSVEAYFDGFEK